MSTLKLARNRRATAMLATAMLSLGAAPRLSLADPTITLTGGYWSAEATDYITVFNDGTFTVPGGGGGAASSACEMYVWADVANSYINHHVDSDATDVAAGTGYIHTYFTVSGPALFDLTGWTADGAGPLGTANSFVGVYDSGTLILGGGASVADGSASVGFDGKLVLRPDHEYEFRTSVQISNLDEDGRYSAVASSEGVTLSIDPNTGTISGSQISIASGGTLSVDAGHQLSETDCTHIQNFGTFDLHGDYNVIKNPPESCSLFENFPTGTVLKGAGSGTSTFYMPVLIHGGTFNVASGAIAMNGTLTTDAAGTWHKTGTGTLAINGTQSHGANASLIVSAGTLDLNTDAGDSTTRNLNLSANASGAHVNFNTSQHIGTIAVSNGAIMHLTSGGDKILVTDSLSIDSSSKLDLDDNHMIVHYSGTSPLSTVVSKIVSARTGGTWSGNGITSSAAAAESGHYTNLGAIEGTAYRATRGGTGTIEFFGEDTDNSMVLVKYTWNGDTNLDGQVDGGDYARFDTAWSYESGHGYIGGWQNGDFNYDGRVDGGDLGVMDAAFSSQDEVLARAIAYVSGDDRSNAGMSDPALQEVMQHFAQFGETYSGSFLAAVPEPTCVAIPVLAAIFSRRRRRR